MGAPDLSSWIWPDADQKRQPQSNYQIDRSNPITAGLQAVINPLDRKYTKFGTVTTGLNLAGQAIVSANANSNNAQAVTSAAGTGGSFTVLWVGQFTSNNPGLAYLGPAGTTNAGYTPQGGAYLWYSNGAYSVANNVIDFGYYDSSGTSHENTFAFPQPAGVVSICAALNDTVSQTVAANGVLLGSPSVTTARGVNSAVNALIAGPIDAGVIIGGTSVNLCAFWNRALTPAEVASVSANPWQIFQPAKLGIAMPASASGLTLALSGVSGTSGTGSLGYSESYALTGSSATGSTGTISEGVSVALSQVSATGSVGFVTPAFGVAATGVSATGSTGSASDATALALTGASATGSTGTVTPTQGLSAALTQVSATGSTGTLSDGLSLALSGVAAAGSVGTVSTGGSVTQALTGVSATGSAGSVTASVSLAATGVSATGSTGSIAPTRALSGVSATGSTGSVTQSVTLALVGSSATGSTGTVSAGANKNAALTGVTGASSVGNVGANIVIGLNGVSATASTGILVPGIAFGLVGNAMASSTGTVIVGYPSVDPITFKVYPESRKYAVSAESRTKPVAAESRTIKVA